MPWVSQAVYLKTGTHTLAPNSMWNIGSFDGCLFFMAFGAVLPSFGARVRAVLSSLPDVPVTHLNHSRASMHLQDVRMYNTELGNHPA